MARSTRARRSLCSWLAAALVGTWSATAIAQTGDGAGDGAQSGTTEDPARVQFARDRYREAVAAFRAQRFGDAVLLFERSFRARPHPSTLYNLAEARLRGGDREGCVENLRQLLGMDSPAPDSALQERARVLGREAGNNDLQPITRDQPTCPECPRCPAAPSCPEAPPPRVISADRGPLPWILGGVGLFALSLGFYGYGAAQSDAWIYDRLANPMNTTSFNPNNPVVNDIRAHGEGWRWVGLFGILAGVGLEVGAVYLLARPMGAPAQSASGGGSGSTGAGGGSSGANEPRSRTSGTPSGYARLNVSPFGLGISGAF